MKLTIQMAIAPKSFKPTIVNIVVTVCIMALGLTFINCSFADGSWCSLLAWEKDKRGAEIVLQVALRNAHSGLSRFECPELRGVPPAVIVKGQRNPVRAPCGCPYIEAIQTPSPEMCAYPPRTSQVLGRPIGHARPSELKNRRKAGPWSFLRQPLN